MKYTPGGAWAPSDVPDIARFSRLAWPGRDPASNLWAVAPAAGGQETATADPVTTALGCPGAAGSAQAEPSVTITSFETALPQALRARTRT